MLVQAVMNSGLKTLVYRKWRTKFMQVRSVKISVRAMHEDFMSASEPRLVLPISAEVLVSCL